MHGQDLTKVNLHKDLLQDKDHHLKYLHSNNHSKDLSYSNNNLKEHPKFNLKLDPHNSNLKMLATRDLHNKQTDNLKEVETTQEYLVLTLIKYQICLQDTQEKNFLKI